MSIYIVKSGDTLFSIARDNMTTPERIIQDNGLEQPDNLAVGQALVILRPSQVYTVREGDTLEEIAIRYGVSLNQLYRNNPLLGGNNQIRPGQVLVINYDTQKRGTISINGYAYPYIDRDILIKTLPYLTYLTIFGYGMNSDGTLIPTDDNELIEIARSYGVSPVMLISSLGDDGQFSNQLVSQVLNNKVAREALIKNVVDTMLQKRYDGIDVDFEFVLPQDKEVFEDFVEELREAANVRGKQVIVSLAPKTSSNQSGLLYEAHDYEEMGENANKVLLMTYEWGYAKSSPMAIAPINQVERVVDYGLSEIPPQKIFMGIPNYAYDWALPYIQGETTATALSNQAAVNLAADSGSVIMFNEVAQTPYFNYTDEGGTLHEVWFEDARSVAAKLDLILKKGLFGGSVWHIMRYFPALWSVINSNVNIRRTGDENMTNVF